jgi:hypothetical protein
MNTFAWNIVLKWNNIIKWIDFDYVENISLNWNKVLFVFWDTELKTSKELEKMLKEKLWEILFFDIGFSSEDKITILWDKYEEWVYELTSFEWEQVNFEEIVDRFSDFEWVISVREAEISNKFWNKIVKVDFVY